MDILLSVEMSVFRAFARFKVSKFLKTDISALEYAHARELRRTSSFLMLNKLGIHLKFSKNFNYFGISSESNH